MIRLSVLIASAARWRPALPVRSATTRSPRATVTYQEISEHLVRKTTTARQTTAPRTARAARARRRRRLRRRRPQHRWAPATRAGPARSASPRSSATLTSMSAANFPSARRVSPAWFRATSAGARWCRQQPPHLPLQRRSHQRPATRAPVTSPSGATSQVMWARVQNLWLLRRRAERPPTAKRP